MSAFLWSCKARPAADNLLFAFLWMVLNTSLCAFSQSYRIRSAYWMCSLALTIIESLHRKLATGRGVHGWVISNMEYWESLWSDLQSRQPPWFMNGLPTGVHEMAFRVSIPLNALQEPWLLSPSHSLQTHPAYFSILNRARRKRASLAAFCTARRAENSLTRSHLPRGIQQGLSRLLLALELCCLRGGMTKVKRNHSSHSLQCTEPWIIYCCYSTDVWNFSTDSQASTEARLSMEDCQNWCSLGEGWWNTATCHFDHIA